jgi:hypothetical protein
MKKIQIEIINKINVMKKELEDNFINNNLDIVKEKLKLIKFNLTILEYLDNKLYKH